MNGKQVIFAMYRKRYERENQYQTCEAYFQRVIGIEDETEYHDTLKTLEELMSDHKNITVFFEGYVPLEAEFTLIETIKKELSTMNVFQLCKEDITITPDREINQRFLNALEEVVVVALNQETFFSEHVRNDFITKLIIWSYSYLISLEFDDHYIPKCVYYGVISRHEIYFLMLAYKMGIDVLYLNPLKEELFDQVDTKKWSGVHHNMGIAPIETFATKASRGTVLTQIETTTKLIQQEIHDTFFDGTGIFKPWQFRKGYTYSLTLDTILEDIFVYWNEQARMRQGFKVSGEMVYVPCFFNKIDGIYQDRLKYKRLVEYCTQSEYTLFFNTGYFSNIQINEQEMYQLMFCQLSDGTFNIDELKKLTYYQYGNYNDDTQLFILRKFNEVIQSDNIFTTPLNNEQKLKLLYILLTLDDVFIKAMDNFDFPADIPKLVIYIEKESSMPVEMVQLMGYLNRVGWDIVLFNPSGLLKISQTLQSTVFVTKRLETMDYNSTYEEAIRVRQGLFAKFRK